MAETETVPGGSPQGIFEPKPALAAPESGTHKAMRLMIILAVLVLVGIVFFAVREPYLKPVKTFYRNLEAGDYEKMANAFPKWLVDADQGEGNVTVTDMCAAVLSTTRAGLPSGSIQAKITEKTDIAEDRLSKIEAGIASQYGVDVKVKKGLLCKLSVQYRETGNGGDTVTCTEYVRLYKINGRWALLDVPSDQP